MENNHEDTCPIDTQEQDIENTEVEQEEFFEDTNEKSYDKEEIEHIRPDLNHTFPSPKMNSCLMTVHNNDQEKFIDDPECFFRYLI